VAQATIAEQAVDVVADALDEVAVVADDHERARPAVEQVLERGQRVDIKIVGPLVEQQHVGLGHQQPHQLQPTALAARQVADQRPRTVAAKAEPITQQHAVICGLSLSVATSRTLPATRAPAGGRSRPSCDSSARRTVVPR
jgi:hypothetical protein